MDAEGYEGLEEVFAGEYPWGIPARRRLDLIEAEDRGSGSAPAPMTATTNTMSLSFSDDSYQGGSLHWPVPARFFFADPLRWDGGSGFVDEHDVRAFFAPSLTEAGGSALLVDRGWMDDFLARYQLCLFWTVLAELNVVAAGWITTISATAFTREPTVSPTGASRRAAARPSVAVSEDLRGA
jgi:hypothetical protein